MAVTDSLDLIGIHAGTDKSLLRQGYLAHYERMLETFRGRPIRLLEIGVHNGASLRVWERWLPSASIVGVDIEPRTRRFARERVEVEIGSQADPDFLDALARKHHAFDVIVDDGSHLPEHQIFTFQHLFHALSPAGLYVVEDIGPRSGAAADYFLGLQRQVLTRQLGDREDGAPAHFVPTEISYIEMIPGACAVWKHAAQPARPDFEALEVAAGQAELPESLFYLAEYIRRHNGPLERALAAVRRASAAEPQNPWMHYEAGKILADMDRVEEAVAAVDQAISLAKDPRREAIYREYRERLLAR